MTSQQGQNQFLLSIGRSRIGIGVPSEVAEAIYESLECFKAIGATTNSIRGVQFSDEAQKRITRAKLSCERAAQLVGRRHA